MANRFVLNETSYHGKGAITAIPTEATARGFKKALVCSDPDLVKFNVTQKVTSLLDEAGLAYELFTEIKPNPTIENVQAGVKALKAAEADYIIAIGGGSSMDTAKAVGIIDRNPEFADVRSLEGVAPTKNPCTPIFAVPTTSGTGSEITNISVLTDLSKNVKSTMNDPLMYPKAAIVDPRLTLSVPPKVTASTGLDVLSHALESVWSVLHQPICESCSVHATKLVFEWLYKAYCEPDNLLAREKMAEASIVAGVAFSNPRTAGSHACSFPLTNLYGVPHGEACAMTLDFFTRYNADAENGRLNKFARNCGFKDAYEMADSITELKKKMGMACTLSEIGVKSNEEIEKLTEMSMTPLMERNMIPLSYDDIKTMYLSMM